MKIETVTMEEVPEHQQGSGGAAGSGKYEPIRQAIRDLPPGQVTKVEFETRKAARCACISLRGGQRRPGNSLHGESLRMVTRGSTLYAWIDEDPTP